MSSQLIELKRSAPTQMMGMRRSALPLRERIERALAVGDCVDLDFSGVEATQSFIDELIGVLVSEHGPSVLRSVSFKGCSANVRGIVEFVASDRARDFASKAH